jgi:hypothetical protein
VIEEEEGRMSGAEALAEGGEIRDSVGAVESEEESLSCRGIAEQFPKLTIPPLSTFPILTEPKIKTIPVHLPCV